MSRGSQPQCSFEEEVRGCRWEQQCQPAPLRPTQGPTCDSTQHAAQLALGYLADAGDLASLGVGAEREWDGDAGGERMDGVGYGGRFPFSLASSPLLNLYNLKTAFLPP